MINYFLTQYYIMLKSKKKVVKKQKPKTTQKQKQKQMMKGTKSPNHVFVQGRGPSHEQMQSTKVVVNIGKTTKPKSRAPRKAPEPVRPQIIPIYTPTYQSQPQQQYNNDDLRTLFRARVQANDNPLKELTREAKLKPINRPPIRLEESKAGYTDPKLDEEINFDYLDPYDRRPPDSIMANAQFRQEQDEEARLFDEQFFQPEQTPTLTEAIGEEPIGRGGGGGAAAEPEEEQDDLDDLNLQDLKELVKGYNRDNQSTKIQITKPNITGTGTRGKNKDELIAELRAKRFIL